MTMVELEDDEGLMTVNEVMELLKCRRPKVYALGKQGRLEIRKFDRSIRITRASLNRLLREIHSTRPLGEN